MDLFDFIELYKTALFDKGEGAGAASNEGEAAPSGDAGSGSEGSSASSGAESDSGLGSEGSAVPPSASSEPASPTPSDQGSPSSDFVMPEFSGEDLDEIEIPAGTGAASAEETPPAQSGEAGTSDTAGTEAPAEEGADASSEEDGQKAKTGEETGEGEAEAGPQKGETEEAEEAASGDQPPSSMEPGQLAQQIQEHRDAMIQGLAENHFALSDAEVEEIETDPRSAIPKLLARTYVDSLSTMLTRMSESVPRMVQHQATVMQRNMQAEQQFFDQFPHIPKDQRSLVAQVAKGYRASFPDASVDEVMKATGEIVTQRLGLTPQNAPQNGAGSQQQGAQKANPDGKPRSTKSPPFQPATAGPSAPAQPPVVESLWEGLGMDHEDEG